MSREVHKFGGASVKDAAGVRNVASILAALVEWDIRPAVVVSAMGKTTNALERVWRGLPEAEQSHDIVGEVGRFHAQILEDLGLKAAVLEEDWSAFVDTADRLAGRTLSDAGYDALVGFGERFSTRIVHAYLVSCGLEARWHSAWDLYKTDASHRAAVVNLRDTGSNIRAAAAQSPGVMLTQGFVGGTDEGVPTTLGREGSDFSGALMAEALDVRRFVVWKDVPGVMTGDPRRWPLAQPVRQLDYGTAERMSQAGAGILHPATMAPLRRAGIALEVRSFLDPSAVGTEIAGDTPSDDIPNLWAFAKEEEKEIVRCLTDDEAAMREEWQRAFPDVSMGLIAVDPEIAGCLRMVCSAAPA